MQQGGGQFALRDPLCVVLHYSINDEHLWSIILSRQPNNSAPQTHLPSHCVSSNLIIVKILIYFQINHLTFSFWTFQTGGNVHVKRSIAPSCGRNIPTSRTFNAAIILIFKNSVQEVKAELPSNSHTHWRSAHMAPSLSVFAQRSACCDRHVPC